MENFFVWLDNLSYNSVFFIFLALATAFILVSVLVQKNNLLAGCKIFAREIRTHLSNRLFAAPKHSPRMRPSKNAEFLLSIFLRAEEQDAVIGDLIERYPKKAKRLGQRRADLWIWAQVIRSIWPLIKRMVTTGGLLAAANLLRKYLP